MGRCEIYSAQVCVILRPMFAYGTSSRQTQSTFGGERMSKDVAKTLRIRFLL